MNDMTTLQQKRLRRVDEAARILNVSRWTVYRWVEAGRLGGTRLGAGSLRIFSHTVTALIEHHCVGMGQGPAEFQVGDSKTLVSESVNRHLDGRDRIRPRPHATV
jgi:excisionase family DNA binding protein